MYFCDIFGYGHERRHGAERLAGIIHIEPGAYNPYPVICKSGADFDYVFVEKLHFVYSYDIYIAGQKQNALR